MSSGTLRTLLGLFQGRRTGISESIRLHPGAGSTHPSRTACSWIGAYFIPHFFFWWPTTCIFAFWLAGALDRVFVGLWPLSLGLMAFYGVGEAWRRLQFEGTGGRRAVLVAVAASVLLVLYGFVGLFEPAAPPVVGVAALLWARPSPASLWPSRRPS